MNPQAHSPHDGLDPAIQSFGRRSWIAGSSPAMRERRSRESRRLRRSARFLPRAKRTSGLPSASAESRSGLAVPDQELAPCPTRSSSRFCAAASSRAAIAARCRSSTPSGNTRLSAAIPAAGLSPLGRQGDPGAAVRGIGRRRRPARGGAGARLRSAWRRADAYRARRARCSESVGLDERALGCGAHWPLYAPAAQALAAAAKAEPAAQQLLRQACRLPLPRLRAGLADRGLCRRRSSRAGRGSRALEDLTGERLTPEKGAVDGCAIPTFAIPLHSLAWASRGSAPAGLGPERAGRRRLRKACAAHPELVAGTGASAPP